MQENVASMIRGSDGDRVDDTEGRRWVETACCGKPREGCKGAIRLRRLYVRAVAAVQMTSGLSP